MKKGIHLLFGLLVFGSTLYSQPVISLVEIAAGFSKPVDISHANDSRLFITEQAGVIKILRENGQIDPGPFLEITDRVNDSGNERGLLGLAFHPDFSDNGYFFVNYTGSGGHTRVSRFNLLPGNPEKGDPNSELILLTINQPYSNHNGGDLVFGPDGYLYIGMGDGGSGGDPQNHGQTLTSLLGKMLRIDVNNQDAGLNYVIPPDNPFASDTLNIRDEIWAIGLRNPWRFSFDRLTGDLWIGDVGQEEWEEIDFQPAGSSGGLNYGWRCYEGTHAYNTNSCGPIGNYIPPVYDYSQTVTGGCSVTGGYVYRGCAYPNLWGYYLFADYCNGQFWAIAPSDVGGWQVHTLSNLANLQYTSFGENYLGELFVTAHSQGKIYRVTETSGPSFAIDATVQDETCEGAGDGAIALSWPPVNEPLELLWENQDTSAMLDSLVAGTYCATYSGGNGCQSSLCVEVGQGVFEAPDIQWNDTILAVPAGFVSYQWYLDGTLIEGAQDSTFMPLITGAYSVEVTNDAGCLAGSSPFTVVINNVREQSGDVSWNISPNPFSTSWDFFLEMKKAGHVDLEVFQLNGLSVWRQSWKNTSRIESRIDANAWPKGAYWVRLSTEKGQWTDQILKQ